MKTHNGLRQDHQNDSTTEQHKSQLARLHSPLRTALF